MRKRALESARVEKKQGKAARRDRRREDRSSRPPTEEGIDPDIAGIIPGPQPVVEDEW